MGGRYGDVDTGPQDLRRNTPANTVKNSTYSTGNRFSGPQSGRTAVSTGGFGGVSRPALAAAAATTGPPSGRGAVSTGGFGQGVGVANPYAGIDVTSRSRPTHPNAPAAAPANPYAGIDVTSRSRPTHPKSTPTPIASPPPSRLGHLEMYGPSARGGAVEGYSDAEVRAWADTEEAQNLFAQNAAPTGPIGMWTEVGNGAQMPDPADADSWQAMQDAVDSEFGPEQDIYNPTYDTERFPTYDPSNTIAPFAPSGGGGYDGGGDFGYGDEGSGAGADMGTFDPNSGEYLQFGGDLAYNEYQRGAIDEGDDFWDLAHERKWDETNRGIPGLFNSRGMLDSGGFERAKGFSAADQDYEWEVQQWQMGNQKAALDAQQAALEQQWTGYQSGNLFGNYTAGR